MRLALVLVATVLVSAAMLPAQQDAAQDATVKLPSVKAALRAGVAILVKTQENYTRDRRVGRMPDSELEAWQKREHDRLDKLRRSGEPGVEWPYEGVYRVGGIVPAGYRVGGSAIVCAALVETPGFAQSDERRQAVARSIAFMLDELADNELLAPGPKRGYDVRGWAHTYALDFFLLALRRQIVDKDTRTRIEKMISHLLECLAVNEVKPGGGWNYAGNSCSPFMTGSTLLALYQAKAQGYDVDPDMVDRALGALERARVKSGAYVYSGTSGTGRSSKRSAMPGACARAAIAELCLHRAGRSDAKRLRVAVDAFFEHWGELFVRKSQQGTHVGAYGIAPYYFMYGHTYAALAIEALPEKDRPGLRARMQDTLWKTREANGGWNDRIFPRSEAYSTAMAMLALLAPELDPVPEWKED